MNSATRPGITLLLAASATATASAASSLVLVLVLVLVLAPVPVLVNVARAASPVEADDSEALFEKALEHYRAAEYRKALELVGEIETKRPGRVRFGSGEKRDKENLHNFKGSCLTALRYFQHARREFEKALATQPESFDMKFNLAEMDFLQEHFAEARAKFAVLQASDRGRLYSEFLDFKIGMCLIMEGRSELAEERLSTYGRDRPVRIFLDTAIAIREKKQDKATVDLARAREKIGEADYRLYEDSLIEFGLLEPHRLSVSETRELNTAMRRPVSLGTDRIVPEEPPAAAVSEDEPADVPKPEATATEPDNS